MAKSRIARVVIGFVCSPWALSIIAVAARLVVFWEILPMQTANGFYRYNEQARIAWALVSGYGFSSPWVETPLVATAQQPPLYPWLLAGIFKIGGAYTHTSLWIAVCLNAGFAGLTAVVMLRLGKQIFGMAVGVLAAWVWSVWLYELAVSLRVWESSLSALLLIVSLWLWLRLDAAAPKIHWAAFGILAGAAALANTSLLSVFACWWFWRCSQGRVFVRRVFISILFCIITLVPWTVRNYTQFHRFIPVRDNFGYELWVGNRDSPTAREYGPDGEISFMESRRDMAMEFIRTNPGKFLRRCVYRFFQFWTDPKKDWLSLSLVAWLGLMLAIRKKVANVIPLTIPVLVFPIVYYITHPSPSYRHPIEPMILMFAAFALVNTVNWGLRRKASAV